MNAAGSECDVFAARPKSPAIRFLYEPVEAFLLSQQSTLFKTRPGLCVALGSSRLCGFVPFTETQQTSPLQRGLSKQMLYIDKKDAGCSSEAHKERRLDLCFPFPLCRALPKIS